MNWATIDFKRLVVLLLPTGLRKAKMISWLCGLVSGLDWLYVDLLYKMQHSCQVIYLEKVLNEYAEAHGVAVLPKYDPNNHEATKKIKVVDALRPQTNYIYQRQEIPPKTYLYLGRKYLSGFGEYYDFVVELPLYINISEVSMKQIIDYYKLAGKKYIIKRT